MLVNPIACAIFSRFYWLFIQLQVVLSNLLRLRSSLQGQLTPPGHHSIHGSRSLWEARSANVADVTCSPSLCSSHTRGTSTNTPCAAEGPIGVRPEGRTTSKYLGLLRPSPRSCRAQASTAAAGATPAEGGGGTAAAGHAGNGASLRSRCRRLAMTHHQGSRETVAAAAAAAAASAETAASAAAAAASAETAASAAAAAAAYVISS